MHLLQNVMPKRAPHVAPNGIALLCRRGGHTPVSHKAKRQMSAHILRKVFACAIGAFLLTLSQSLRGEVVGGFDFPKRLAGFELQSVIDNDKTNPGLGVTLLYNAPGVKISVFVYDRTLQRLPDGIDALKSQREFAEAKSNIHQTYSDAKVLAQEERFNVAGVPMLHAAFQYTEVKPGVRETVLSHLYLASRRGHFVKVRATYSGTDRPQIGHRTHVRFVEELCRLLGR